MVKRMSSRVVIECKKAARKPFLKKNFSSLYLALGAGLASLPEKPKDVPEVPEPSIEDFAKFYLA